MADIWTIPTRYSICHTARLLARRGKGQSLGCRFTCQCTTFPTTLRTQYRSEACLIVGDSSDHISSISMIYHNRADPHPVGRTVERSDSPTKYKSTEGALVSAPHVTATSWAPHDCGASTLRGVRGGSRTVLRIPRNVGFGGAGPFRHDEEALWLKPLYAPLAEVLLKRTARLSTIHVLVSSLGSRVLNADRGHFVRYSTTKLAQIARLKSIMRCIPVTNPLFSSTPCASIPIATFPGLVLNTA